MTGRFTTTARRLLPALAVGAVLGLSALLPTQGLGASSDVGYGYANNCGVKGDGFHDHGKPCPNRPFPGRGNGIQEGIENSSSPTQTSATGPGNNGSHKKGTVTLTSTATKTSSESTKSESGGSSSNHGHAHGNGHGRGHSNAVDAA